MLYTLQHARALVKPFVDSGSCRNEVIDQRINEALERLYATEDWEGTRRLMRFRVHNGYLGLPFAVEKVMWAAIDGTPARVFGRPYQFMSSGRGDLDYRCPVGGYNDLVDYGEWPTMYDAAGHLVAVSSVEQELHVSGTLDSGSTVQETLTAKAAPAGVDFGFAGDWDSAWESELPLGTVEFASVGGILKAEGATAVSVYVVADGTYTFLGELHPLQTRPQFRRYRLTKSSCENTSVLALARLRFVPLVESTDLVPLDSLQALRLMVIAIREELGNQSQNARQYEADARRLLTEKDRSAIMASGTPVLIDQCHRTSLGRHLNRSGIRL